MCEELVHLISGLHPFFPSVPNTVFENAMLSQQLTNAIINSRNRIGVHSG